MLEKETNIPITFKIELIYKLLNIFCVEALKRK